MAKIKIWIQSLRAYAYSASIVPVFAGVALAFTSGQKVNWFYLPFIFLGVICLHSGTNLINDYYDFKHGVDTIESQGSSGVLTHSLLSPGQVKIAGISFFITGALLAIPLILKYGYPILLLIAVGILGGYFYTGGPKGYKYFALGDLGVFILMGPLIVVGTYYGLTGLFSYNAVYVSIPIGLLVAAILHANNMRDIIDDKKKRVKTISVLIGLKLSKIMFFFYLVGSYISIAILIYLNILTIYTIGVALTLPFSIKLLTTTVKYNGKEKLPGFVELTSLLHLIFGAILSLSILFKNYL